ncbi:MAG: 1-phosphofructokinase [Turicibacter sp.]|nr:1-phosphofructokinase [Turicibacter sp.]
MIYTLTLNPAIDYVVRMDALNLGEVNRMQSEDKFVGGKGINVSRILHQLGMNSTALGFVGGFTGKFIEDYLADVGISTAFTQVKGDTRINVKIKGDHETEINGPGPEITTDNFNSLINQLDELGNGDVLILAGSAPKSLGSEKILQIIKTVKQKKAEFVIDMDGPLLLKSLPYAPLLIKPNAVELSQIFERIIETPEAIQEHGQKLLEKGAQNVLISMGGDGALLFTKEGTWFSAPIKGQLKNSVGAGDSMIAGFIGTWLETKDGMKALEMGTACGTATAFSDDLATRDFIMEMKNKVNIKKI